MSVRVSGTRQRGDGAGGGVAAQDPARRRRAHTGPGQALRPRRPGRRREPRSPGTPRRGSRALARGVRRRLRRRVLRLRDRPLARGGEGPLPRRPQEKAGRDGCDPQGRPRGGRESARRDGGPGGRKLQLPAPDRRLRPARRRGRRGLQDPGRKVPLNVSFAAHSPTWRLPARRCAGSSTPSSSASPRFRS